MSTVADQMAAALEQQKAMLTMLANETAKQSQAIQAQRDMIAQMGAAKGGETVVPVIEMNPEIVAQLPEQAQREQPSYFIMHPDPDDDDVTICKPVYPSDMN